MITILKYDNRDHKIKQKFDKSKYWVKVQGKLGGGGSIRIEPSRQLLDDCTHKRNSKRKVGKPIYH